MVGMKEQQERCHKGGRVSPTRIVGDPGNPAAVVSKGFRVRTGYRPEKLEVPGGKLPAGSLLKI